MSNKDDKRRQREEYRREFNVGIKSRKKKTKTAGRKVK